MPPSHQDPRRADKIHRFKPFLSGKIEPGIDDCIADYCNIASMIGSMLSLMLKLKWWAWFALYCSCLSLGHNKLKDDKKQILSSFMLSFSALVMCYIQDPKPMLISYMNS